MVNLFFSLYIEQCRLELNEFMLEFAKYVYERAVKLYEAHQISEENLLETEIEYHRAQNNNNDMAISMARQKLADYLDLNEGEKLWVIFSPTCLDAYKFNYDPIKLIEQALQYSTEVSREYDKLQNEQKLKNVNNDSRPSVSLSVGGGINRRQKIFLL